MAHIHSVYDTDKHFTIDPLTRNLQNMTPGKAGIMQYDHNSERITFELPAVIEGHNTLDCNVVEVHYLNIDAQTKNQNPGLYVVDDLQAYPEDETISICSWLISRNATQLVGPLCFRLTFKCVSDEVDYSWNTAVYKALSVSDGIDNSGWVIEEYADVLEQWEQKLVELDRSAVKSVNGVMPDEEGNVSIEAGGLPMPTTASVGQYIAVSAVDESGKVTATEAVSVTDIAEVSF